jgi:hypothetical protein
MIVLTGRSANWAGMSANGLPANFQRQLQRPSWLGLDEMSVLPSTAEIISHSTMSVRCQTATSQLIRNEKAASVGGLSWV